MRYLVLRQTFLIVNCDLVILLVLLQVSKDIWREVQRHIIKMSDSEQIPASEILQEAAEYLCKLGSNLHNRSESLKEKRISKEKLKNSHAILKTVDKILIICELSKKSLANVEDGVKKVMNAISKNKSNVKQGISKNNLRISRKINLKHYKSVKVLIRKMTLSDLLKYPVYYDCKLKSMQHKKKSDTTEKSSNWKPSVEKTLLKSSEKASKSTNIISSDSDCDSSKKESSNKSKSEKEIKKYKNLGPLSKRTRELDSDSSNHTKPAKKSHSKTEESSNKSTTANEKDIKIKKNLGPLSKRTPQLESDSSNQINPVKKRHDSSDSDVAIVDSNSTKSEDSNKKYKAKYKDITIFDSSSNEENQVKKKKRQEKSSDKSSDVNTDTKSAHHSSDGQSSKSLKKANDKEGNQSDCNSSTSSQKPTIKCIDITKLLKSPAKHEQSKTKKVQFNSEVIDISQYEKDQEENMRREKEQQQEKKRKEEEKKLEEKRRSEELFWEKKRQEVLEFKAKEFTINVCKLPELSEDYLKKHNLNSITRSNVVLISIKKRSEKTVVSDHENSDTSGSNSPKVKRFKLGNKNDKIAQNSSDTDSSKAIDKVKKALLIDSSSEDESLKKCSENLNQDSCNSLSSKKTKTHSLKKKRIKHVIDSSSDNENINQESSDIDSTAVNKTSEKSGKRRSIDSSSENKDTKRSNSEEAEKSINDKHTSDGSDNNSKTKPKIKKVKIKIKESKSIVKNPKKRYSIYSSSEDDDNTNTLHKKSKESSGNEHKNNNLSENERDSRELNEKKCTSDSQIDNELESSQEAENSNTEKTIKKDDSKNDPPTAYKSDDVNNKAKCTSDSEIDNEPKTKSSKEGENSNIEETIEKDNSENDSPTAHNSDDVNNKAKCTSDSEIDNEPKTKSSKEGENSNIEETIEKDNSENDSPTAHNSDDENNTAKCTSNSQIDNEPKTKSSQEGENSNIEETIEKDNSENEPPTAHNSDDENNTAKCTSNSQIDNKPKTKSSQEAKNSNAEETIEKGTSENDPSAANNSDDDVPMEQSSQLTHSDNKNCDTTKDNDKKECEKSPNTNENSDNGDNTQVESITPTKQSGNNSSQSTPQSKRKQIMETMEAKRMLLTDSSSESEDGKRKESRDAIKKKLLTMPDDSNSDKEAHKRNMSISSDEDVDIIRKVKRRRKKITRDEKRSKTSGLKDDSKQGDEGSSSADKKRKMGRSRSRAKPSSSDGLNTDAQDSDKSVEGLTKLGTLHKLSHRKKASTSSNSDEPQNGNRRSKRTIKHKYIKTAIMLEAESKSESSADEVAEEADVDDELPAVDLGMNGVSPLKSLAKTDLLEESNESSSDHESANENDDNDEENNEQGSDEEYEENVRTKRRKGAVLSSDSEGNPRRKKMSDFDDSEPDSSEREAVKRKRRKNKSEDSDASAGSSSSATKKKRRRIKQVKDSDASGSGSENEGKKHGRKNIRKVMGKDQLEEATKKAAREEKERIARISERQKMYNNLEFDESGKPDEVIPDKVVLDFDPDTKEPLIEVDRGLVKKLKPHQANGIKFMWNACFESVKRIKKDRGSGCILAHCMGLGKTLQVVSLIHTLLTYPKLTSVRRVLVVCPLSTVLNWVNEFNMWLKHAHNDTEIDIYELSRYKQNSERAFQLQQWLSEGGVCVLGYEMFRNLSADNTKKFRKKMLNSFQQSLVDPGPDLVVCDEGHLLKNEKTSLSQSMNRVRTLRRIVLTGTPLQNNLKEYYCMVQFVKPNLLGKYNEYLNRFVNPITNGQYTDSTDHDIKIMKRRSHVLHKMLDGAVQRRDYGVLAPFLPPKHEYVLFITLTEVQIKLYQHYLDNYSRRPTAGKSSGFLFPDFQSLQRIWTHPLVLKYNSERYEIMQQKKREREEEEDSEGSLVNFIDDDSTPDETSTDESSDDLSDLSDNSRKKNKKKKHSKKKDRDPKVGPRRGTRANPNEGEEIEIKNLSDVEEVRNENPTEWWIKLVTDDELDDMKHSSKLVLLFDILRQCEAIGDKLLVFSQSLYSLDLIEHFLSKVDDATQEGRIDEKLCGHVGSWSPGIDYFRLDGSTSCENRSIWCKNFNREDNPRARLFLISTRAGGLGINLVAANRVVIFDVSWNPSHDVQSIFRVYRFGQKKPCYVYRFLAMGTMEEKIYERQVTKQAISKRVIDEQQIDRHYAENDLQELYNFEPTPPTPKPIPPLPKDRLFAEMLKDHDQRIYKFHEHDSLLENKEEETLSEEERKAAWEDFENEKNKPPPPAFNNMWGINGMAAAGLMAQQQQMAYAALSQMLRKDMPTLSEEQIRNMLPMIYNANPSLMQKMNDIYKYAQPGLMNPGMMNPMMNPAAVGGAGSGSSGLQYEPPWQRQQQLQQQQRLQQLMQHQNMGAKFYAGGLGSRDPVAMAQQQQLARQLLLGDSGANRARGRPPLQPRAPHELGDVVNLDSD